jgi:hypothetical protein
VDGIDHLLQRGVPFELLIIKQGFQLVFHGCALLSIVLSQIYTDAPGKVAASTGIFYIFFCDIVQYMICIFDENRCLRQNVESTGLF